MNKLIMVLIRLCGLGLLVLSSVSKAKDYQLQIGAGVAAGQLPTYAGSPDNRKFFLPFPYVFYQDDSLTIDRQAIDDKLLKINDFTLSLSAAGSIPVDSEDNSLRKGMPDIGWIGELGPALTYQVNSNTELSWQIHKASSWQHGHYINAGWRSNVAFNWRKNLDELTQLDNINIHIQFSLHYADSKYHDIFYGVTPQHAQLNRQPYNAQSGVNNIQFSLGATWRYNNLWLGLYAKHYNLAKAVNINSPLLTDEHQSSIGFAAAWIFIDKK